MDTFGEIFACKKLPNGGQAVEATTNETYLDHFLDRCVGRDGEQDTLKNGTINVVFTPGHNERRWLVMPGTRILNSGLFF